MVNVPVEPLEERSRAEFALELSNIVVHLENMLIQVGLLREGLFAARARALVWFLLGVRAHVVHELLPILDDPMAVTVFALVDFVLERVIHIALEDKDSKS